MNSPRFTAALIAGKLCAVFCKAFFPKRGSNLPGRFALRLDPLFLRRVKGIDPARTIFITGTNGKSTANNMVVHAFQAAGLSVCSNLEGANMKPGAASALIKHTTMSGRFTKQFLILEVDERSLSLISKDLKPGHLCVTNIQKDQVQRNGEPDYIYQKIKAVIGESDGLTLYLNNDEPRALSLGGFPGKNGRDYGLANDAGDGDWNGNGDGDGDGNGSRKCQIRTFGVAPNARASETEAVWGVTMPCPICHDALVFTHFNLAGVGAFHCPACGFHPKAEPDLLVSGVDFENLTFNVSDRTYRLAYQAAFFLYNYALCACVCAEFGVGEAALEQAFATFTNISGRMETFSYAGKTIKYMRIKQENPETLQSALDTIAEDKTEKAFVLGPAIVDDIIPHYSNTFYTFDCNFEPFMRSGIERCICFGSAIGWDTANRLRYAGVPDERIEIVDTDDDEKILAAIAACETKNVYLITWIKKYEKLKAHSA